MSNNTGAFSPSLSLLLSLYLSPHRSIMLMLTLFTYIHTLWIPSNEIDWVNAFFLHDLNNKTAKKHRKSVHSNETRVLTSLKPHFQMEWLQRISLLFIAIKDPFSLCVLNLNYLNMDRIFWHFGLFWHKHIVMMSVFTVYPFYSFVCLNPINDFGNMWIPVGKKLIASGICACVSCARILTANEYPYRCEIQISTMLLSLSDPVYFFLNLKTNVNVLVSWMNLYRCYHNKHNRNDYVFFMMQFSFLNECQFWCI